MTQGTLHLRNTLYIQPQHAVHTAAQYALPHNTHTAAQYIQQWVTCSSTYSSCLMHIRATSITVQTTLYRSGTQDQGLTAPQNLVQFGFQQTADGLMWRGTCH